jgi:hypothetical protein
MRRISIPGRRKAMDEDISISRLDDFEVIAERALVKEAIAALTDRYRRLCREMTRRETLRWMLP